MNDALDPILQQEEQRKLRTQLIWRLGIAALLVAGVVGTLFWLDQDRNPPPRLSVTNTPSPTVSASTPQEITSHVQASASDNISSAAASIPSDSMSETASTAMAAASAPAIANQAINPPANVREATTSPALPTPATAMQSPAKPAPTAPPKSVQPQQQNPQTAAKPSPATPANGYTLQAGAFLHASNAEKLLLQVQRAGIPVYLETRVQIGPFRTKAEAEAALFKLRKLGIDPVLRTE